MRPGLSTCSVEPRNLTCNDSECDSIECVGSTIFFTVDVQTCLDPILVDVDIYPTGGEGGQHVSYQFNDSTTVYGYINVTTLFQRNQTAFEFFVSFTNKFVA